AQRLRVVRARAGVVWRRGRVPPRCGGGLHQDCRDGGRAGGCARRESRTGMTLWAGRVGDELAAEVWEFLRADDAELLPYDCAATLEHAKRLAAAGIITAAELAEVESALAQIHELSPDDEDVHSAIERQL